jgi:diadenosine tetraphosphate (Ap4A) HIT family hydrolase
MTDCLLCRLVRREVEVSMVYEDDWTVAFMDIRPVVSGHMLVVPRGHAPYLADLDPEDGARLFRVGQQAAAALRESDLRCDGVNFFLADGAAAGQEIFHVHLHVFPRYEGDGFGLRFPPDYSIRPRDELDRVAAVLIDAWDSS